MATHVNVGAKHQSTDYRRESGVSYYIHQTVCSGGHRRQSGSTWWQLYFSAYFSTV